MPNDWPGTLLRTTPATRPGPRQLEDWELAIESESFHHDDDDDSDVSTP